MILRRTRGRTVGNILLGVGLLLLAGAAGYFGLGQLQARDLQTSLANAPAARLATPAVTLAAATQAPSAVPSPTQNQTTAQAKPAALVLKATETRPAPTTRTAAGPTPRPTRQPTITPTLAPVAAAAPVRLVIPDLKIDVKVVPMGWQVVQTKTGPRSDWVIPKNEAGHHINSAAPGRSENMVISGHNNIFAQVFKPISVSWSNSQRIKVDNFTDRSDVLNGRLVQVFDAAGVRHDYIVVAFYRLKDTGVSVDQRMKNGRFMLPTGVEQLTLITCWPPTSNTHRLIVIAKPAQPAP